MKLVFNKQCLSEKETASLLGYTPEGLKKLRHRKSGPPYFQLANRSRVYYDKESLEKWLKSKIEESA